jgi:hypothetical protein
MNDNQRIGFLCVAVAVAIASLVNLNQTFKIEKLESRTKALEAACKVYGIALTTPEAP